MLLRQSEGRPCVDGKKLLFYSNRAETSHLLLNSEVGCYRHSFSLWPMSPEECVSENEFIQHQNAERSAKRSRCSRAVPGPSPALHKTLNHCFGNLLRGFPFSVLFVLADNLNNSCQTVARPITLTHLKSGGDAESTQSWLAESSEVLVTS